MKACTDIITDLALIVCASSAAIVVLGVVETFIHIYKRSRVQRSAFRG